MAHLTGVPLWRSSWAVNNAARRENTPSFLIADVANLTDPVIRQSNLVASKFDTAAALSSTFRILCGRAASLYGGICQSDLDYAGVGVGKTWKKSTRVNARIGRSR